MRGSFGGIRKPTCGSGFYRKEAKDAATKNPRFALLKTGVFFKAQSRPVATAKTGWPLRCEGKGAVTEKQEQMLVAASEMVFRSKRLIAASRDQIKETSDRILDSQKLLASPVSHAEHIPFEHFWPKFLPPPAKCWLHATVLRHLLPSRLEFCCR